MSCRGFCITYYHGTPGTCVGSAGGKRSLGVSTYHDLGGSVNVDTETSLHENGIDAHVADYLLDINRDILEVDTTLNR